MSNNLLSKNHPFRASVTHGSIEINSDPISTTTTQETEEKQRFNLSPKTKLICLGIVGLVTTYGWINIYDSMYPPKIKPTSAQAKAAKETPSYEDVSDFEWGISTSGFDDEVSAKPGWFKQTFCKGVKRSIFCR